MDKMMDIVVIEYDIDRNINDYKSTNNKDEK